MEETEKSQASARPRDTTGDPDVSGAAAGRAERGLIGGGARTGASRVRGLGREQEARFFELR